MSWNTSIGVRVLNGPEKELFVCGAMYLHMILDDCIDANGDDTGESDVYGCSEVFNEMSCGEKLIALEHVVKKLTEETPTEDLYAWSEATVHAVFVCLGIMLSGEIDAYKDSENPDEYTNKWKGKSIRYWLDKCGKKYKCYDEKPSSLQDMDIEIWESVIESMEERILWDFDFLAAKACLDLKKEEKENLFSVLGLDSDYFVTVPPGTSKDSIKKAVDFLNSLDCLV